MIEGIPSWLFYAGATFMVLSWGAVSLLGAGSVSSQYATFDLLTIPSINRALHSRSFRFAAQAVLAAIFVLVIVTGLFGNQQAGTNLATILTWTYWWTLLVLFVMLFGKAWCYVCPWEAMSEWLERLSFWRVTRGLTANLKWPRVFRNLYPATALFLALTWLELGYGVTTRPELTALLGILMFFLAFVPLFIFERQSFCRYGCLVGRISGLYALFSALEIRPRDPAVCKTACKTHDCFHGNERGYGCPTFQYLGAMQKNTYCIYCGECIKTCTYDNVALNLRPFGQDMVKDVSVRFDEATMVIVMLAMTTFHGLTMTPVWGTTVTMLQHRTSMPYLAAFTVGMFGFLILLGAVYYLFAGVSHRVAPIPGMTRHQLSIHYAYAFLPIALFYHFAHNSMHFFIEGGSLVPVLSDPFGWGWNLFGTARIHPGAMLPQAAVWTIMLAFIFAGQLWSLLAVKKISLHICGDERTAWRSRAPLVAAMIGYSILSLWIVAQPMTMRTGL